MDDSAFDGAEVLRESSCLPAAVAESVSAAKDAVDALASVRVAALSADAVRELAVTWHRLAAQVDAGRLAVLAAIDGRDDIAPRSRGGQAAAFGQHVLGLTRTQARRDARGAGLLDQHVGELRQVGAAYAAGGIGRGHVEIAVGMHKALGARARQALISAEDLYRMADDLGPSCPPGLEDLVMVDGAVRQIEVVDAVLAHHAHRLSVPEFEAVARRIVDHLNPPSPSRAHERRFLHMSRTFDGSWVGKFSCGPAQGVVLKAALAALSAPRPGSAIDADGVERTIQDDRDLGTRQMDALIELVSAALAAHSPATTSARPSRKTTAADDRKEPPTSAGPPARAASAGLSDAPTAAGLSDAARADGPAPPEPPGSPPPEPPEPEGEGMVVRPPGVPAAPFPPVELVLVVGVEHVAAARAAAAPDGDDLDGGRAHGSALAKALGSFRRTASPAQLGHGDTVDDETLDLLACSATIRAAILEPGGGALSLGRRQRLASRAQRLALHARDGGCVVPGCGVAADGCHAHHGVSWESGGRTDVDNLVLACARHHIEIHQGIWEIQWRRGAPWVRPPAWVDRGRPLLRNAMHHGPGGRQHLEDR